MVPHLSSNEKLFLFLTSSKGERFNSVELCPVGPISENKVNFIFIFSIFKASLKISNCNLTGQRTSKKVTGPHYVPIYFYAILMLKFKFLILQEELRQKILLKGIIEEILANVLVVTGHNFSCGYYRDCGVLAVR